MSEFKIKPQRVRSAAQDMNNIAKQMKSLEDQILGIQRGLSFEVAQKERIRQRLRTAGNETAARYKGIYSAASALNNIANTYETTENGLVGSRAVRYDIIRDTALDNIRDILISSDAGNGVLGVVSPTYPSITTVVGPGLIVSKLLDAVKDEYGEKTVSLDDLEKALGLSGHESEKMFSSVNKDDLKKSDIEVQKILEKTWSGSKSALHSEGSSGDKDGTHASYNLDLLKREASAELYAGLYYMDPETGEKKLRAAAGGALGFTVSAFTADAEAQLGNSYLGAYGKGEVTVGKVGAKAEGKVGLRDEEGKFNPTLHGKVSAEAIAAEASVKGGVKVAGTDVGIKASANVGIGAHAEAGYKDGKFSLDVGASFGIGGSVKLEIDVSGTIDAVSGGLKKAWNAFSDWF